MKRARGFSRRFPWYLKLDVEKYFDSVDHDILMALLERRFKDGEMLELFRRILDSYHHRPGFRVMSGIWTI